MNFLSSIKQDGYLNTDFAEADTDSSDLANSMDSVDSTI